MKPRMYRIEKKNFGGLSKQGERQIPGDMGEGMRKESLKMLPGF